MLFSLVLMRMSGFILLNPIFGRKTIPSLAKAGMVIVLTVLIFPLATGETPEIGTPIEFGVLLIKEFIIGYFLGFIIQLFEFAITFAGSIIDFQMGLSMASVFDIQTGGQVALTGNILQVYFMLLFFAVDGHLALMKILVTSAEIVPYGQIGIGPDAIQAILAVFLQCVFLAVKLALPIIGFALLLDTGVGILMKIVPQINLFVLDIPLKILIGITMLLLLVSPIGDFLGDVIAEMLKAVQHILTTV